MEGAHYGPQITMSRSPIISLNETDPNQFAERVHHPADDQRLLPDVSRLSVLTLPLTIPARFLRQRCCFFSQIREAIEEYEPRVRVQNVDFDTQEKWGVRPIVEVGNRGVVIPISVCFDRRYGNLNFLITVYENLTGKRPRQSEKAVRAMGSQRHHSGAGLQQPHRKSEYSEPRRRQEP